MSNEKNDQMPELLDNDAALDDDDEIVDLLEVVKPGTDFGAKKSGAEEVDFSADLDAMLEKLESAERALDVQDDAAPFPDPTPVDHTVDPDETLDMPSMDDLNTLLETLGASTDAPEAKDTAGAMPNLSADLDSAPIMKQASPPVEDEAVQPAPMAVGLPDLDELLAAADAGTKAVPKAAPAVARSAPVAEVPEVPMDLDDLPMAAAPIEEASAQAEISLEDIMPAPENLPLRSKEEPFAPAAQSRPSDTEALAVVAEAAEDLPMDAGQAQPSTAPRYDEVDLNELDALLDDMLASAPASGPAPATPARTTAATPSVSQAQGNLAPLQEAVIRMENSLQGLQAELKEKNSLIETQQVQIDDLRDALEHMRGNMDKLAAEAAAKVIREELAALLREEA